MESTNIEYYYRVFIPVLLLAILTIIPTTLQAQDQLVLQAPYLPANDTVWVFTPANYAASQQVYPAVYLLHGYSGSYHQWDDIINLQKLANRFGFVIICPDGFYDSWYINSPVQTDHQYEHFFFEQLMPTIFERYRLNESQIFISGLSMGGHGALYLFSQQPQLFKAAGSTSGVVNLTAVGSSYGLTDILGSWETHKKRWQQFSVINHLKPIKKSGKKIIFDVGHSDPFFKMNKAMSEKTDSMGIDATFITRPGGHNAAYWHTSIPYHFFFFKQLTDKKQ